MTCPLNAQQAQLLLQKEVYTTRQLKALPTRLFPSSQVKDIFRRSIGGLYIDMSSSKAPLLDNTGNIEHQGNVLPPQLSG